MRKPILVFACILACVSSTAYSQPQRRSSPKRPTAAEKSTAQLKAGRELVAAQVKTLSHFLYVFGGVAKGIESAVPPATGGDASPTAAVQNERSKAKVKESIGTLRQGLEKFETDFRANTAMTNYYQYVVGVANLAETAENHAASNRYAEAGKSLLKAVDQLTDALAAMR